MTVAEKRTGIASYNDGFELKNKAECGSGYGVFVSTKSDNFTLCGVSINSILIKS